MAGLLVLVWLGLGLCGHLTVGHGALTTSTTTERSSGEEGDPRVTPCVGQQALAAIAQDLKALKQAVMAPPLQHSVAGLGSSQGLLELKTKVIAMETKLETSEAAVRELRSALERTASALQETQTQARNKGASTFVRWGRKTCSNSSQLLYSGVVGGSQHTHTGAAANALCLTRDPEFDSAPLPRWYTNIYGAEYQYIPGHHDHDVPCSVCRTPHPTTLMIPSTHSCPSGWTTQYSGHLVAGRDAHTAATEFVCLDEEPEDVSGGHKNDDGKLFYYVVYACGSLRCPPYVNKAVALCVVCSK